ncbi:MarR family transcriptional regulator [Mucilaginibacter sp. dw_454]|uniref:MarR family winged helix-turn-helix transcriptional regulator n=1 Tax=Mucilaginibacter sp. dw_454 TaxID=2720079 RepID=UPI001BD5C936|nr:MarR family transcriptional regulator [Mucilaginibacter sp. dw_454]
MKVKDEITDKFNVAMLSLVQAIKRETENCGKACGGLNEKELVIVYLVGQKESIKMSEIAANIDAPMSTLTNIVDKLVEKKILSRGHSSEDRRVINVFLDSMGKTAYKTIINQNKKLSESFLSQFDDKTQGLVIKHIHVLASSLNNT